MDPHEAPITFAVVGEALVDLVETLGSPNTFTAHAGGSPFNVALTLGRLGQQVSLIARSGRDAFGRLLEAKARQSGVSLDRWQIVDEPTSLAVASLDDAGRAQYDFYLDATAGLGWDASLVDLAPSGGVLHLASVASWRQPSGRVIQAMQQRAFGGGDTLISYDPNVRAALIANVDVARQSIERCIGAAHLIKASDEDAALLYPDEPLEVVARRWCALGAQLVVLTLGESGAVAFGASGELVRRPGLPIRVADTVGAGDSFAGGLLAGIADSGLATCAALRSAVAAGDPRIGAALEQAIVVSAITCERSGAEPPTRAELDARLASLRA